MRLSKDTIKDFDFLVVNPERKGSWHYELLVSHKNGISYPIVQTGNCTIVNSSEGLEGDNSYSVGRSDEFGEVLSECILHSALNMETATYSTLVPEKMPNHDKWLIDVLMGLVFGDRMTYEFRELLERIVVDEAQDPLEKILEASPERRFSGVEDIYD